MFICGFIDILKLTNCNYITFLFSFIGISFAYSKFLDTFVLIMDRTLSNQKDASESEDINFSPNID